MEHMEKKVGSLRKGFISLFPAQDRYMAGSHHLSICPSVASVLKTLISSPQVCIWGPLTPGSSAVCMVPSIPQPLIRYKTPLPEPLDPCSPSLPDHEKGLATFVVIQGCSHYATSKWMQMPGCQSFAPEWSLCTAEWSLCTVGHSWSSNTNHEFRFTLIKRR